MTTDIAAMKEGDRPKARILGLDERLNAGVVGHYVGQRDGIVSPEHAQGGAGSDAWPTEPLP